MLVSWIEGLRRYNLHGSPGILDAVHNEACRVFKDRLTNPNEASDFELMLCESLQSLGYSGTN